MTCSMTYWTVGVMFQTTLETTFAGDPISWSDMFPKAIVLCWRFDYAEARSA